MPIVDAFLKPRLRLGAIRRWRAREIDDVYPDDSEWLEILSSEVDEPLEVAIDKLSCELKAKNLLTYHACRPVNIGSYMTGGIRALDEVSRLQLLEDAVTELHITDNHPMFLERAKSLFSQPLDQFIYVVLDKRNFLRFAGHYLIYGSEWMCAVFGSDFRYLLKKRGTPTCFEVNLSLALASEPDRRQLSHLLLREYTRMKTMEDKTTSSKDFTFAIRGGVPSKMILGHSHPSSIPDPFDGRREFTNDLLTCDLCSAE
jgi:hypothetical protein